MIPVSSTVALTPVDSVPSWPLLRPMTTMSPTLISAIFMASSLVGKNAPKGVRLSPQHERADGVSLVVCVVAVDTYAGRRLVDDQLADVVVAVVVDDHGLARLRVLADGDLDHDSSPPTTCRNSVARSRSIASKRLLSAAISLVNCRCRDSVS